MLLSFALLSLTFTQPARPRPAVIQLWTAGRETTITRAKESLVNADLSVAPEIAQLAMPLMPAAWEGPAPGESIATTGQLATGLARLAAAPQRWWDLVRFNPDGPAVVTVPAPFEAWLLVLPPGASADCHCELATLVAGEASADGPGRAALRQGRVRVHGSLPAGGATALNPPARRAHAHGNTGHGYSVSLHAGRAGAVRSV